MWPVSPILTAMRTHFRTQNAWLVKEIRVLNRKLDVMNEREQLAWDRMTQLVAVVEAGVKAKDAEIRELKIALGNADQNAQQRVDDALSADSEHDAQTIEAANEALSTLVAATQPTTPGGDTPDEMPDPEELPVPVPLNAPPSE